ncbi:NCA2-domain-containing protein [Pseudovirgaria hyperparasitica]|uniref:NCA2-domain-containing protein n=1 Tax=Pseudovirgaria hyperparasitica TaxID=470096 RepID=A0A6A6WEA1_9PEZI|nr:NCA2-domain-containing protein [Pseudovirgaria hyperparasitica]KAF2761043.1 NCA2-domain-containing protein [Pseudovirgaria hyperparasitica]
MSFVVDQVRRIDSQLDRLQLSTESSDAEPSIQLFTISDQEANDPVIAARVVKLQSLIKSLSSTTTAKYPLVPTERIVSALRQAELSPRSYASIASEEEATSGYEHELEWLLLSKATVQAYGQVLDTILAQTILLSDDIWYWDDVLGSYRYAGLYSIQTSPIRLWNWGKEIYAGVRARDVGLEQGWQRFYGLVRDVVRERNIAGIQRRVVSPIALVSNEARKKRSMLKKMRLVNANALGVLLGESLSNESIHDEGLSSPIGGVSIQDNRHRWKSVVTKSIALMEAVLTTVGDVESTDKFDELVAATTQDDPYYEIHEAASEAGSLSLKTSEVGDRLYGLLTQKMPQYTDSFKSLARTNGRPPMLIRYWLPMTIGLLSSSTLLRIFVNRREEIMSWVREFGQTVIDFGVNWVIEPTKKIIGTIRHDEDSEISIMSKRSLQGDRESLERMVVDFAVDHPEGPALNETQISDIRARVKEGDLTTVLKAYEKDMQRPFIGTVKGNLIRALLIQVQKTKVDVEIAMSGIDSMLKSQELLFGVIGLTPGILITIAAWRYLRSLSTSRQGIRRGTKQGELMRILRNIDRILVSATPTDFGELSYKDHGLLLCEVHLLRQTAYPILPRREFQDFREETDELVDIRAGLTRQLKVAERIRWAYSKYF